MNDAPRRSRLQQDQPAEHSSGRRRRKNKKSGKVLYYAILAVLLGILIYSSVKIISYVKDQKNAENIGNDINQDFTRPDTDDAENTDDKKEDETKKDPDPESIIVDFDRLQARYSDVVGYVYSANTVLKYPIVQTAEEGGDLVGAFDGKEAKLLAGLDWSIDARQELRVKLQAIGIDARVRNAWRFDPAGNAIAAADAVDDFSVRNLAFQIRYRYELAPLSYLYVVYGRGGFDRSSIADGVDEALLDSFDLRDDEQLLVKLSYRFEI